MQSASGKLEAADAMHKLAAVINKYFLIMK